MFKRGMIGIAAAAIALSGCAQNASVADIDQPQVQGEIAPEDLTAQPPDSLTVFQNVDNHPTIVRLCLDGVAFRTVSTQHQNGFTSATERVPEWDAECATKD